MSQIGWINQPRYKWAEWTGKEIKFKPATFYLGVIDHLAKAVEGQTRDNMKNQDFNNGRNQIPLNGLPRRFE
jgi:triacylglycerol lipase